MRIAPALVLVLALNPSAVSPKLAPDSPRPITEANTILSIYAEDWGRASSGTPKLILVVWDDGHVVWSEDQVHGGAPYRPAHIDPGKLTAFLVFHGL